MKPRIRKIRGVWCCGFLIWYGGPLFAPGCGHGNDPIAAYEDWKAQRV